MAASEKSTSAPCSPAGMSPVDVRMVLNGKDSLSSAELLPLKVCAPPAPATSEAQDPYRSPFGT